MKIADERQAIGPHRARRVMIVDGCRDSVDALTWLLAEAGCEVSTCADAATALADAIRTRPDVVFLDLWLDDGLSGVELVRALRRLAPAPAIVVVSGWVAPRDRDEVFGAGCDRFIAKPADPSMLVRLAVDGLQLRGGAA